MTAEAAGDDRTKPRGAAAGAVSLTPQGVMGAWIAAGMVAGVVVGLLLDRLLLGTLVGVGLGIAVGAYASRGRRGTHEPPERTAERGPEESEREDRP